LKDENFSVLDRGEKLFFRREKGEKQSSEKGWEKGNLRMIINAI